MSGFHGFSPRSGDFQPPSQYGASGKFGRMFPQLPPLFKPSTLSDTSKVFEALEKLGNAMVDTTGSEDGDNLNIPSGYTYLGQFIDHDITFDSTSLGEIIVDPLATTNFRTPKLDLDSLYGGGPKIQPYLYKRAKRDGRDSLKFIIGNTTPMSGESSLPNDLPRSSERFALIGDPRNDENLILAQLHLAFLKFHNKVIDKLDNKNFREKNMSDFGDLSENKFEMARKIVTWHYQSIILYDYLPKITGFNEIKIESFIKNKGKFYQYSGEPFIPVEFSMAIFRFGHSMIRPEYHYNREFSPPASSASLKNLFDFTGNASGDHVPIFNSWIIDWNRFFDINKEKDKQINFSRKINPFLTKFDLSGLEGRLAFRNLKRGMIAGLPSGQKIAHCMELEPLTETEVASGSDGKIASKYNFHRESPLWYYILKEAQIRKEGMCLGDVGSHIFVEVITELLKGDSNSFVAQNKKWKPTLPARNDKYFTMSDLLRFVNDLNPLN